MSRSLEGLRDALGRAAIGGLITVADEPLLQPAPDWAATSVTVLVAE
jgi:hypothetical protein